MAKTVFDVLKDKIEEQVSSAENFLSNGWSQRTTAEYREVCGLLRGLRSAQAVIIEDLSRNYMDGDDD